MKEREPEDERTRVLREKIGNSFERLARSHALVFLAFDRENVHFFLDLWSNEHPFVSERRRQQTPTNRIEVGHNELDWLGEKLVQLRLFIGHH